MDEDRAASGATPRPLADELAAQPAVASMRPAGADAGGELRGRAGRVASGRQQRSSAPTTTTRCSRVTGPEAIGAETGAALISEITGKTVPVVSVDDDAYAAALAAGA